MWLMTNRGFYSIVEKPWDKADQTLTVRARTREDIEAFIVMIPGVLRAPELARKEKAAEGSDIIEEDPQADYRWRIRLHRSAVKAVMLAHLEAIDYDNFKSSVAEKGLAEHATAYHGVWSVMNRLQEPRAFDTWESAKNALEGGGNQTRLPFGRSSGGSTVARELGYAGDEVYGPTPDEVLGGEYEFIGGEWVPVLEDEAVGVACERGACPYCGEEVEGAAYDATGQCGSCDSHLEICGLCFSFLGPSHACTDKSDGLPF